LANELNLDPRTKVRLKSIDVELLEGDLKETPWLIEDKDKNYILMEEDEYDKLMFLLRDILDENLEYKIKEKLLDAFPIDFEDAKLVVKKEMEEKNLPLEKAIEKVKREYPNLFHKIDFEEYFSKFS
jgi:DNA polymerase III delta prime subunit